MDLGVNQSNDSEKKWKGYNWCYTYDDNGEEWLKDSCADCPMCIVDDIFYEAHCKKKDPCENG